ncbi:MAG: hypothetical protein IPJ75_15900 [Ignavibacteriales bacterium]|nr:hypothetical protein [Ignavibacteriales bacterium]
MYNNQYGMSNKQAGGCGLCKFAGLAQEEMTLCLHCHHKRMKNLEKQDLNGVLIILRGIPGKPLRNEQGVVCPQWKDDRS